MEWYWVFLEQSANLVEAIMMVVLLSRFFERRYAGRWPYLLSTLGIFAVIDALNYFGIQQEYGYFGLLIYYSIGVIYAFFLYRGNRNISRFLVPLLMISLIAISEMLTIGALSGIFGIDAQQFNNNTSSRLMGIIISKVLLIMLVFTISRFVMKKNESIPTIYSICLLIIPVISIVTLLTIGQYVLFSVKTVLSPLWFSLTSIGLLFINLLIVYLFEALMKHSRTKSQYHLMVQQAEMLSNHLREINALQQETNRIWHDMKNHFTVIQWMVKTRAYGKLEQYMQTLNEAVASSALRYQSGHPILDALLNAKAVEAGKYGIELDVNAAVPPRLPIDDLDLNVVFSNALDNALDACRKLPEGRERFIKVDAFIKSDHLILTVKNPFDGVIKKEGDTLQTTKKEAGRHGIGMGNMMRTVEKYDGYVMTNYDDNVFVLSAIMHCELKNIDFTPKNDAVATGFPQ